MHEATQIAPPPATTFARPSLGWFLALDGGLIVLAKLAFDRKAYEKVREVAPLPEQQQLQALFGGAVALHVAEALVAGRMAQRRGFPAGRWVVQTFVVGFPSLRKLRSLSPAS